METPARYEMGRSHNNKGLYVFCYEDRFYEDIPLEVLHRGPWYGSRGDVIDLKPHIRLALARDGYCVIEHDAPLYNPTVKER